MGLVYDTASAQVIQVVKCECKSRYLPTEIDKNLNQLSKLLKFYAIWTKK